MPSRMAKVAGQAESGRPSQILYRCTVPQSYRFAEMGIERGLASANQSRARSKSVAR